MSCLQLDHDKTCIFACESYGSSFLSELPVYYSLCDQCYQASTVNIPGVTSKIFTWDKHDEIANYTSRWHSASL